MLQYASGGSDAHPDGSSDPIKDTVERPHGSDQNLNLRFSIPREELEDRIKSKLNGVIEGYDRAYFFVAMVYTGDSSFKLQEDELTDFRWASKEDCMRYFALGRPERAAMMMRAIDNLISDKDR